MVALVLFAGDGGYRVTAEFVNAGQLVKGNEVRVAGAPVGTVEEIDVSHDGRAEVTFTVDDDYAPLRQRHRRRSSSRPRCRASPTASSTSSSARTAREDIEDGGRIDADHTATAVELDEVFAMFDEETRGSLRGLHQGPGRHAARAAARSCAGASTTSTRRCPPAAGCSRS